MARSYLRFVEIDANTKTKRWEVHSTSDNFLGVIRFYPQWRQFVFAPNFETLYNKDCMEEISAFCDRATKEWRDGV